MQKQIVSKLDRIIFANLLATVLLSVLAFGTVEPWSLAVFELNALLLLLLLSLRCVLVPIGDPGRFRIALPLLGLLLLGVCQFIPFWPVNPVTMPEASPLASLGARTLSLEPYATRQASLKLLALLIYFLAAIHVLNDSRRRKFSLITLTVFGFAVSLFAIVQRFTYNGKLYWFRSVSPYIAPYGPYGNYNHFSGLVELILPLPLAWIAITRTRLEMRVIALFSVVMMAVALIFSLSRGGMLALAAQGLAFIILPRLISRKLNPIHQNRDFGGNKLIIPVAAIAVLVMALWIGYEPLLKRVGGTLSQGAGEYSVTTRMEYWRASWRIFLDHPLAGAGIGAFPAVYPAYGKSTAKFERLEQTHNDYLQLLTDAGIIGALLGIWFLFELIAAVRRIWPDINQLRGSDTAIVAGGCISMIGIFIHSFLDFNLQIAANALLFLFVVALLTSSGKLANDPKSRLS